MFVNIKPSRWYKPTTIPKPIAIPIIPSFIVDQYSKCGVYLLVGLFLTIIVNRNTPSIYINNNVNIDSMTFYYLILLFIVKYYIKNKKP